MNEENTVIKSRLQLSLVQSFKANSYHSTSYTKYEMKKRQKICHLQKLDTGLKRRKG